MATQSPKLLFLMTFKNFIVVTINQSKQNMSYNSEGIVE